MITFFFCSFNVSGDGETFEIMNVVQNLLGFVVPLTLFIFLAISVAFNSCGVWSLDIFFKENMPKYCISSQNVLQGSIEDPNTPINDESSETKQIGRRLYEAVCSDGCNGVSISVFAEPWSVYKCHCQECRDSNFRKPVTWIAFSQKDVQVSASGAALSYENKRFLCSRCLTKIYMVYKRDSDIYINRDLFKNMAFRDAHIENLRLSIPKFEAAHIWLGTKTCTGAKYLDTDEGKLYAEEHVKPTSWAKYNKFST